MFCPNGPMFAYHLLQGFAYYMKTMWRNYLRDFKFDIYIIVYCTCPLFDKNVIILWCGIFIDVSACWVHKINFIV